MFKKISVLLMILVFLGAFSQSEDVQARFEYEFGRAVNFLQSSQLINFNAESEIDGSLESFISVIGTFQNRPLSEGDTLSTICETSYTFETSVDGTAYPLEVFQSTISPLESEGRFDITCGWRVDFAPFYFTAGTHRVDSVGCQFVLSEPCQEFSSVFEVFYEAELQQPVIRSLQPSTGSIGDLITIRGLGFSANPTRVAVSIGGLPAQILSASLQLISAVVPANLQDGAVATVQVSVDGLPSNTAPFTIDQLADPIQISIEDYNEGFMVREVIFFLTEGLSVSDVEDLRGTFGFVALQEFQFLGLIRGVLPPTTTPNQTIDVVNSLRADGRVKSAFLNFVVEAQAFAQAAASPQPWLDDLGGANIAALFPNRGAEVKIAVIDSGLALNSQAVLQEIFIEPTMPNGLNLAGDRQTLLTALDGTGHGTAVTTIAAGRDQNGIQGEGVASQAQIIPIRVFEPLVLSTGEIKPVGNILGIGQALSQAYLMDADVINMSLQNRRVAKIDNEFIDVENYFDEILDNIAASILAEGLSIDQPVMIAATGNDRDGNSPPNSVSCPACVERIIAVGSVFQNSNNEWIRSLFSNWGDEVDFVAQGEDISTTLQSGGFGVFDSGTSFSAPQVAGLAALILGEDSSLSADEVKARIENCFVQDIGDPGKDLETGWGRILLPGLNSIPQGCF